MLYFQATGVAVLDLLCKELHPKRLLFYYEASKYVPKETFRKEKQRSLTNSHPSLVLFFFFIVKSHQSAIICQLMDAMSHDVDADEIAPNNH